MLGGKKAARSAELEERPSSARVAATSSRVTEPRFERSRTEKDSRREWRRAGGREVRASADGGLMGALLREESFREDGVKDVPLS